MNYLRRHPIQFMLIGMLCALALGCGPRQSTDDVVSEDELTPEEKKFLSAARPFLDAIVTRDYAAAFAQLSSDARASMNLNQFVPPTDDRQYERNRAKAISNVQPADFAAWMNKVEQHHGAPAELLGAHVFSTERDVLAGRGNPLDVMLAIGAMPKSVPVDQRRASLRCQIGVKLSEPQLKQVASEVGVKLEDLRKDPEFRPYFNLKFVLVEEQGALKVGYFEFMPPSMLD